MANQNVTGSYVPLGNNHGNQAYVEATLGVMANLDTAVVALPDGVDKDMLPVSMQVYGPDPGTGILPSENANLAITQHDKGLGQTTLTASGAITAGSKVILGYLGG